MDTSPTIQHAEPGAAYCALCQQKVATFASALPPCENEPLFCCKGCAVVFDILQAQGSLDKYRETPIFQQALRSGLISNPEWILAKAEEEGGVAEEWHKLPLLINGMWCPSCATVIQLVLLKEEGVKEALVDYSTDLASIVYAPRFISKEKILDLIGKLGYFPQDLKSGGNNKEGERAKRLLKLRFIVALFFSLNVMMFAYPIYAAYLDKGDGEDYAHLFAWLSFAATLPVFCFSGWPIWQKCFNGLKVRIWGMEALVTLGVFSALALSLYELFQGSSLVYFDSLTVIILFVLLGKILESKAKFSAKEAFERLSLALPKKGRKKVAQGKERFVPIAEIAVGDLLIVKAGEKIPLDGTVEEGKGACDESLMTGEPRLVGKKESDRVLAGSFLQQGELIVKVSSSEETSLLARILQIVNNEIGHKSQSEQKGEKIARAFIPFVLFFAGATFAAYYFFGTKEAHTSLLHTALMRSVSVLLISCPCAIGIAAPLAESSLLAALAKKGLLVRNRACLAHLGRETLYAFDKTGTVTEGKFALLSGLAKLSFEEQRALKTLVSYSLHPISIALNNALYTAPLSFDAIEEIVGKGLRGSFQGSSYLLGSALFLSENGIKILDDKDLEPSMITKVYFAKEKSLLTELCLGDEIKTGAADFVRALVPAQTWLISGDRELCVSQVARLCHFNFWKSRCLPHEKKETIDAFKQEGEIVCMIGDGINDAAALASAQVSIAVSSASEFSLQSADIVLTTASFEPLLFLRKQVTYTRKIITQNFFWTFFYNVLGLPLAALGFLTPLFAAFAMVMSSLMVLCNAQRVTIEKK